MHEAELYNKTKAIVFSILNRDGVLPAYIMLENYRSKLPLPSLDKSTTSNIVACGQRYYDIFDPHTGDGEWITKIYWKHPVIENH